MKTICVVTGSRADYGLLYWPMKEIINQGMKLKLVVTGSHLSAKHGRTIEAIKADGFAIDSEVDIKINGDRPVDICESMGEAISRFSKYFEANRPDFLLILGDRYEIFSVVQAAMVHNIPIGHIHGGEVTEGAIDDVIRHSITKLSSLHFTSAEEYRQRVIQLGEHPSTVFKVGAPGLDNIKRLKLLSRKELEDNLGCTFNKRLRISSMPWKPWMKEFLFLSRCQTQTLIPITFSKLLKSLGLETPRELIISQTLDS
jgi:GDP/UDP-N,N'-diacetylbacillosamine 2-epimerase (hydrolysing)